MKLDRRDLLLGGILASASGGALLARSGVGPPAASEAALDAALPRALAGYHIIPETGFVLPQRDALSEQVYDRYVVRGYGVDAPGRPPIRLVIAYGSVQDYGLQLHRPESCYPAAGFRVANRRIVSVKLEGAQAIPAVAMTAIRSRRREQILYWTRVADAFPTDLWEGRLVILRQALRRDLADGVVVRMSVLSDDPDGAIRQMAAFNQALCAGMGPAARRVVLGRA